MPANLAVAAKTRAGENQRTVNSFASPLVFSDGSFTYTPDAGFTGRDWFTWQVQDGNKLGEYATVFLDVLPVTVSLSVNQLKPGDPNAIIPSTEFPQDANHDPQYATVNLNFTGFLGLSDGSEITLSTDGDNSSLDVYSDTPGAQDAQLLMGRDNDSDSKTWTIGIDDVPPAVYAVGLAGTDVGGVKFTLSVAVGAQAVGGSPIGGTANTNPITTTQTATVQGKGGYLAAFDGTWMTQDDDDLIYQFAKSYPFADRDYHRGVGNDKDNALPAHLFNGAFGGPDAGAILGNAWDKLVNYYQDPAKWGTPVDSIGWSRGAFQAVMLDWYVSGGIPNKATKRTRGGSVTYQKIPPIPLRFTGLVSPVGQMGPTQQFFWKETLPAGVKFMAQALDSSPRDPFYWETTIGVAAGTTDDTPARFHHIHGDMGFYEDVGVFLYNGARTAGIPIVGTPTLRN